MYTISHNSSWHGSFPTREGAKKALIKKGWVKVPVTKARYLLKRKGQLPLLASIICIARPNPLSELPGK